MQTTNPSELFDETNRATYCPEDNKLRLYVGRVPRDQYEKLRADGWQALPKQRELGKGDFAATWTPSRRNTALAYAEIIEDEDAGPAERAADRAERFSGYRDKRTEEATTEADRYDAGPSAHGYQSQARADRAAARHDRIADRAGDAWDKAEYWTRRTAGVISHALYKSTPGVRMGRIKVLEAELRKMRVSLNEYCQLWRDFQKLAAIADAEQQTKTVRAYLGARNVWAEYMHPRLDTVTNLRLKDHSTSLYTLLTMIQNGYGSSDITGAEACALFFSNHSEPGADNDWTQHLTLRLAYENQMLEAQGGRAAHVEMVPGGLLGGKLIVKVCKSNATGRVVSVFVKGPKVDGWQYRTRNVPGADYSLHQFETERMSANAYTPPTPESLAELEALKAEKKAKTPAKAPCPLINPTDADAERLQAILNERAKAEHEARNTYKSQGARDAHSALFKPSTVCRITQAVYSANSKGSYARAETKNLCADATFEPRQVFYDYAKQAKAAAERGPAICQVRQTSSDGSDYGARRVIILTDKPQKPFPAAVWDKYQPAPVAAPETVNA